MSGINMATTYGKGGGVTSTAQVPGPPVGAPDFFYEMARRLSGPTFKKKEEPVVDYEDDQHRRKMLRLQEQAAEQALAEQRSRAAREGADQMSFTKYIGGPNTIGGSIASTFDEPGSTYAGWRPGGAGPAAEVKNPWIELNKMGVGGSGQFDDDPYFRKPAAQAQNNSGADWYHLGKG